MERNVSTGRLLSALELWVLIPYDQSINLELEKHESSERDGMAQPAMTLFRGVERLNSSKKLEISPNPLSLPRTALAFISKVFRSFVENNTGKMAPTLQRHRI